MGGGDGLWAVVCCGHGADAPPGWVPTPNSPPAPPRRAPHCSTGTPCGGAGRRSAPRWASATWAARAVWGCGAWRGSPRAAMCAWPPPTATHSMVRGAGGGRGDAPRRGELSRCARSARPALLRDGLQRRRHRREWGSVGGPMGARGALRGAAPRLQGWGWGGVVLWGDAGGGQRDVPMGSSSGWLWGAPRGG